MIAFAVAVFLLLITPGPGVLSAAGMGSAYGYRAGLRYVTGLFIGTNLVALAVVSGLAAVILAYPVIRTIFLIASAGYLCFLAYRVAFAGSKIAFMTSKRGPGILSGIMLQAINPKAYAVNTTLFSGFPFFPDALIWETITKFVILNSIWIPIHLLWLAAGVYLHRLDLSPRRQFQINILMALAMIGVVVLASLSIF